MERKALASAELKMVDEGPGSFTGYASRWDELDSEGDVVAKGAFRDTLAQFKEKGFIAWSHSWQTPVATIKDAREDGRGLFLEAEFHSDPESQIARTRTAERLARGKFMGLSIGYLPVDFERTEKGRRLTTIQLFETSLVTVPALSSAGVLAAKSALDVDEKAGRRLSAASIARIRSAMDTLSELLGETAAAGDAEEPEPTDDGLRAAGERLATELDGYATRLAAASPAELALLGTVASGVERRIAVVRARLDTALARAADPDGLAPHALHRQYEALLGRLPSST